MMYFISSAVGVFATLPASVCKHRHTNAHMIQFCIVYMLIVCAGSSRKRQRVITAKLGRTAPPEHVVCQQIVDQLKTSSATDSSNSPWVVSSSSQEEGIYICACGKHSKKLQCRSVYRAAKNEMKRQMDAGQNWQDPATQAAVQQHVSYCKICNVPDSAQHGKATALEQQCYGFFQQPPNRHLTIMTEYGISGVQLPDGAWPKGKRVDVYCSQAGLCIEIDGQQHMKNRGMKSVCSPQEKGDAAQQASRDLGFNNAVWSDAGKHVKGLLRLHCEDTSITWNQYIRQALQYAHDNTVQHFICFTPKYGLKNNVQYV